jgi:hypothetical protein
MTTSSTTPSTTTDRDHGAGLVHPLAGPFLLVDAATTGLNGLAYVLAGRWLADWFGAPVTLVRGLGVFLLVVAAGVTLLATRTPIPRRGVWALVVLNTVWVVASVDHAVVADLTRLGTAWVLLQAVVVGVFAAGQAWFARRG